MTDAELVQFANDFREGLLDGRSSERMCAVVCWPLAGMLRFSGEDVECVEGDLDHTNHIWIRLADGRALDPTADQFGPQYPKVYLGPPIEIHPPPSHEGKG